MAAGTVETGGLLLASEWGMRRGRWGGLPRSSDAAGGDVYGGGAGADGE